MVKRILPGWRKWVTAFVTAMWVSVIVTAIDGAFTDRITECITHPTGSTGAPITIGPTTSLLVPHMLGASANTAVKTNVTQKSQRTLGNFAKVHTHSLGWLGPVPMSPNWQ